MKVALRVDFDTYTGVRRGLPRLLASLRAFSIRTSMFFSLGPDNMGRHLLRLFRKDFLVKMLRSSAPSLYGWEILFRGTILPGPMIHKVLSPHLADAVKDGHEIGLHAWDHHRWQSRVERMTAGEIVAELGKGLELLSELSGRKIDSFAAPGWRATAALLEAEAELFLRYASDCRGKSVFLPVRPGRHSVVPQVPVTLPTYDEAVGREGVTPDNYNRFLLSLLKEDGINVLAIHAEVEGMKFNPLFEDFLRLAAERGIEFIPLGDLLPPAPALPPPGKMCRGSVSGREGWVAIQDSHGS